MNVENNGLVRQNAKRGLLKLVHYAYLRVSTNRQEERKTYKTQMYKITEAAKKIGVEINDEHKIIDIASGKNTKRKQFLALMDLTKPGDTIWTYSQDRLSRDTRETISLMELFRENDITIMTPEGELKFDTPQDEYIVTVMAATSKLERQQINKRLRDGIHRRIAEGKPFGRPRLIRGNILKLFNKYHFERGINIKTDLARLLGVHRGTVAHYMKTKDYLKEKARREKKE